MRGSVIESVDYSRTRRTGFAREAVAELNAVVVGAGALGNEVAKDLGLIGSGRVLMIDPDVIERHNLTRSVLFRVEEAIGRNKAQSLAEACRHYFPDTAWEALEVEIADAGFDRLAESDIIFSCVDNELARLEIAYIGTRLDRPVCDAGLGAEDPSTARVSFFPGRRAASFCCLLPPARRRELLTLWDCRAFPCGGADRGSAAWPGTPTAAAAAGSMQVEIGLRMLSRLRAGECLEARSLEFSLDPPRLSSFRVPMSSQCPFHEELPENCVQFPASPEMTVSDILALAGSSHAGEPVLVLDWPICVSAKCRQCGHQWAPMKRIAAFHHSGQCPSCGTRRVALASTIHRIGRESHLSGWRLGELGLPRRHWYTIEFRERESHAAG